MEAVILCGVQGSGKTTLYRELFVRTHVHVSMDELGSRAREAELLRTCLDDERPFVVDSTNPTAADRGRYVEPARAAGFKVVGYLVEAVALPSVPPAVAGATARRLVPPAPEEGFDELWHATGRWRIEPLVTTPPLF